MKTYLLVHLHKHGDSEYVFKADKDCTGYYNEENFSDEDKDMLTPIFKELHIDFEPEINESITINEHDLENIPEIKL